MSNKQGTFYFMGFVGTQVFGCINPLLAVLGADLPLSHVYLLATKKVQDNAKTLEGFCGKRNLPVTVIPVPDMFSGDSGAGRVSFCAELESYAKQHRDGGERCIFNAAGGTNFMIGVALVKLMPFDPILLQVTQEEALLTDTHDMSYRSCCLAEGFSPEEIFMLQNVHWKKIEPPKGSLLNFCKRDRLPIPQNALQNVEVGGIGFELIWSGENNRLSFLFNAMNENLPSNDEPDGRKMRLEIWRNLQHWAETRERDGQMYDRSVIAVSDDSNALEHLDVESRKIKVVNVVKWRKDPQILRGRLKEIFAVRKMHPAQPVLPKKRTPVSVQANTLITFMGNDPQATLLALATHRLEHTLIGYTPDRENDARKLRELAAKIGVGDIRVFPCDISGKDVEGQLVPEGEASTVCAHITAGTKSLGSHLVWWACRHSCPVWAFNPEHGRSERLDADAESVPIVAHDYLLNLAVRGIGCNCADPEDMSGYDSLLDFLSLAMAGRKDDMCFKKTLQMKEGTLAKKSSKWVLTTATGGSFAFIIKGGEWFEYLAARAFERAGARNVHVRVRIERTEASMRFLRNKYKDTDEKDIFLCDMDVVGSFGASHFLVSCKSNPYGEIEPAAREAAAMATSIIGRFTLVFLCHMKCREPFLFRGEDGGNVYVIGWRELCQPQKLAEYVLELRRHIGEKGKKEGTSC